MLHVLDCAARLAGSGLLGVVAIDRCCVHAAALFVPIARLLHLISE